jgi:hypothetical protein
MTISENATPNEFGSELLRAAQWRVNTMRNVPMLNAARATLLVEETLLKAHQTNLAYGLTSDHFDALLAIMDTISLTPALTGRDVDCDCGPWTRVQVAALRETTYREPREREHFPMQQIPRTDKSKLIDYASLYTPPKKPGEEEAEKNKKLMDIFQRMANALKDPTKPKPMMLLLGEKRDTK